MAPDMEIRASTAIGAMEGLIELVEGQQPGMAIHAELLAPLMRVVFDSVKKAVPSYRPIGAANDFDDDE